MGSCLFGSMKNQREEWNRKRLIDKVEKQEKLNICLVKIAHEPNDKHTATRIKNLITQGAQIDAMVVRGNEYTTSLLEAVNKENLLMAEILLQNGADVNLQLVGLEITALHAASMNNHEMVQLLIYYGAEVNMRCVNGSTALFLASISGQYETLILLQEYADDLYPLADNGSNALMVCAKKGFAEETSFLIKIGYDVNQSRNDGMNALLLAVMHDKPEIVEILFQNGANPYAENNEGKNALMLTTEFYYETDAVERLILQFYSEGDPNPPGGESFSQEDSDDLLV